MLTFANADVIPLPIGKRSSARSWCFGPPTPMSTRYLRFALGHTRQYSIVESLADESFEPEIIGPFGATILRLEVTSAQIACAPIVPILLGIIPDVRIEEAAKVVPGLKEIHLEVHAR